MIKSGRSKRRKIREELFYNGYSGIINSVSTQTSHENRFNPRHSLNLTTNTDDNAFCTPEINSSNNNTVFNLPNIPFYQMNQMCPI